MIKENQKILNGVLLILDIICFMLAFLAAWFLRLKSGIINYQPGYLSFNEYFIPIIVIIPLYLIIYYNLGLYNPYRIKSMYTEMYKIFKGNVYGIIIFTVLLFIFKEIHYSRILLFLFAILCTAFSIAERILVRKLLRDIRRKGFNKKHILFVGGSYLTEEFLERIKNNSHWGYQVMGILDDETPPGKSTSYGIRSLGKVSSLESFLQENKPDEIFITFDLKEYYMLRHVINICEKYGIRTQIIPGYYKYIPARPYVEELDGLPVINIRYIPLDNILNSIIKRALDIIFSLTAIILTSPIMAITALLIKLTSPGPVIFKQIRVGLNNKSFTMYKFRSMKLQRDDEEEKEWTTKNDPRKTKFGSFIRKTSIDELPQFFNVLKGDMSIVGPRPERPYFVEKFKEEIPKYMVKHQVRPGITGWAQVNGLRGDTSIEKRIDHDIYYIEHWSLLLDIRIMFLTIINGFINKNAY
ncbi:undecaprenyl-phosphate glucose phosphotransferase [Alloiococcus sp. CFN-8]|uniref:undecaprenyl-phosphate glucose phosphotransferase n=1 Tax=Alloiococcus sp. CFN-8 TaxID=3416081 RepID=UPI003CEC456C